MREYVAFLFYVIVNRTSWTVSLTKQTIWKCHLGLQETVMTVSWITQDNNQQINR